MDDYYKMVPYFVLFLVGTVGNISVLNYVVFITRSLKCSMVVLGNTLVYVIVLSTVDLLVTLSIPFHISFILFKTWAFGLAACKFYWILELTNKMCSTFILTALAFDRYMAICHPKIKRIHSHRQTICIVLFVVGLSLTMSLPVIISSHLHQIQSSNMTVLGKAPISCGDGLTSAGRMWIISLFSTVGFLLPCSLLTFFYFQITLRLRRQIRTMLKSRIPIRRITIYTLVVTLFYLCCQVPYWVVQLSNMFHMINIPGIVMWLSHMLPFTSAALNWLLYAQLNSQFKKGLVLVAERLIRKQTRSTGRDTWDGETTRLENVIAICPNCDHPLSIRASLDRGS